jgi:molecular chaperone GrpE
MEQPSDSVPGGTVIQTLQPGYALFGRTVRAAMVAVAAKGSGPAGGAYSEANTTGGNFDAKA